MAPPIHWLSPGDPLQRTGGFIYNARAIDSLRRSGRQVVVHALRGDWPWPSAADLDVVRAQLSGIPAHEPVVADGLLWPGLGPARDAVVQGHPVVVLVHSLLDKEGVEDVEQVMADEARAIEQAHGWVATSDRTAALVRERVGTGCVGEVVIPGCDSASRATGSNGTQLLCVATITPRKGHAWLLQALSGITGLEWTLDCAGALDRDPACVRQLTRQIEQLGLSDRVRLLGELSDDALEQAYQRADVLVHAASFEGFGMGLAEALQRGIPVVSTPAGCLDSVSASSAIVVAAGDADAMQQAIGCLLQDPVRRAAMADAAHGLLWPTWDDVARDIAAVVDRLEGSA